MIFDTAASMRYVPLASKEVERRNSFCTAEAAPVSLRGFFASVFCGAWLRHGLTMSGRTANTTPERGISLLGCARVSTLPATPRRMHVDLLRRVSNSRIGAYP